MRIRMFFGNKDYRSMVLKYVKIKIVEIVTWPYHFIKALYQAYRLQKDYPNPWDRHVKTREIINANEARQEQTEVFKLHSKLIGAETCYIICMLASFSYKTEGSNATIDDYAKNLADFNGFKATMQSLFAEFKQHNVSIPEELESLIDTTEIDDYTTCEAIEEYATRLNGLIDSIIHKSES